MLVYNYSVNSEEYAMNHLPTDPSREAVPIRVLKSDFLEYFTHISPATIAGFWLPIIALLVVYSLLTASIGVIPWYILLGSLSVCFVDPDRISVAPLFIPPSPHHAAPGTHFLRLTRYSPRPTAGKNAPGVAFCGQLPPGRRILWPILPSSGSSASLASMGGAAHGRFPGWLSGL